MLVVEAKTNVEQKKAIYQHDFKKDPVMMAILTDEHIEGAAQLFSNMFCGGEPLTRHLKIKIDEFKPFAVEVVTKAAKEGHSIVAVDELGRVMGCAIAEDFCKPLQLSNEYPALAPIFAVLDALSKPVQQKKYKPRSVIHIWVTAIHDSVKGLGLSTRLNNACVGRALHMGFSYVYAEFTNAFNERHMNHFPENIKLNEIVVSEFEFQGEKPFQALQDKAVAYICSAAPFIRLNDLSELSMKNDLSELSMGN